MLLYCYIFTISDIKLFTYVGTSVAEILGLCDKRRKLRKKKLEPEGSAKYNEVTTVKQGKAATMQDLSGKCLTEERQILNRWTEYCSELYNYKANGDPSVLDCPKTDTEDDHPVLRRKAEAAVQSLKKGKSTGVDSIPAEVVKAGREDVITTLTAICNKIWQTGEWPARWTQS